MGRRAVIIILLHTLFLLRHNTVVDFINFPACSSERNIDTAYNHELEWVPN